MYSVDVLCLGLRGNWVMLKIIGITMVRLKCLGLGLRHGVLPTVETEGAVPKPRRCSLRFGEALPLYRRDRLERETMESHGRQGYRDRH